MTVQVAQKVRGAHRRADQPGVFARVLAAMIRLAKR